MGGGDESPRLVQDVEALDVYHTDMHAFDMLEPDKEPGKTAVSRFLKQFEYALEHDR